MASGGSSERMGPCLLAFRGQVAYLAYFPLGLRLAYWAWACFYKVIG